MFGVRSVYFNVRNILPKSGTFARDILYNVAPDDGLKSPKHVEHLMKIKIED